MVQWLPHLKTQFRSASYTLLCVLPKFPFLASPRSRLLSLRASADVEVWLLLFLPSLGSPYLWFVGVRVSCCRAKAILSEILLLASSSCVLWSGTPLFATSLLLLFGFSPVYGILSRSFRVWSITFAHPCFASSIEIRRCVLKPSVGVFHVAGCWFASVVILCTTS